MRGLVDDGAWLGLVIIHPSKEAEDLRKRCFSDIRDVARAQNRVWLRKTASTAESHGLGISALKTLMLERRAL